MTASNTERHLGTTVVAVDEIAELFAAETETSEEFERAVADVMALLTKCHECTVIDFGEDL
ncbi:hypothetical protein AB0K52_15185 [Glycomyces sp. NPDC049804]|uniref:hypothetical protein n=1 Tax=Glycomyces sp. NPDC049804 TaxID=3154363 RepID=UPI00342E5839